MIFIYIGLLIGISVLLLWQKKHLFFLIGKQIKRYTQSEKDKLKKLYPEEDIDTLCMKQQYTWGYKSIYFIVGICIFGILIDCIQTKETRLIDGHYIERKQDQGIEDYVPLVVEEEDGNVQDITLEIPGKLIEDDQKEDLFLKCYKKAVSLLKGENVDLDHITKPLVFMQSYEGYSIKLEWNIDQAPHIFEDGQIYTEDIKPDGLNEMIELTLIYGEDKRSYDIPICIYPIEKNGKEDKEAWIQDYINEQSKEHTNKNQIYLPDHIAGQKVVWKEPNTYTSIALSLFGIVIFILIFYAEKENQQTKLKQRGAQLRYDYPEFVHKLVMLCQTGISVKAALKIILDDATGQELEKHYLYKELKILFNRMQHGCSEFDSYEYFGKACGEMMYIKLCTLLIQYVRLGAKGSNELLNQLADEAILLHKENIKKRGEIAGTKLLIPMGILLIIVLIILITPAFLTMK